MEQDRIHKYVRRGHFVSLHYNRAIDYLQERGFITELWVGKDIVTLRWAKRGSKWHTSVRHDCSLQEQLTTLSGQVLMWAHSRERGIGNECNYAVREE